jgi:hypothetical protein
MNRQHITSNYPKIMNHYNIVNNNNVMPPMMPPMMPSMMPSMMPVIAINISSRPVLSASEGTQRQRIYAPEKTANYQHRQRPSTGDNSSRQHKPVKSTQGDCKQSPTNPQGDCKQSPTNPQGDCKQSPTNPKSTNRKS